LIKIKDVVLTRIPYPNKESGLYEKPHMYICIDIDDGDNATAIHVKCDSYNLMKRVPCKNFHVELKAPLSYRHPFNFLTYIDLDKVFITNKNNPAKLIAPISEELLQELLSKFDWKTLPDNCKIPFVPE
jgi:hypothetical protein